MILRASIFCLLSLAACARSEPSPKVQCPVSLIVLGIAQDAGKPQVGNDQDAAWSDPSLRRHATSLAIIDWRGEKTERWLFEATPDIKEQLHTLNATASGASPAPDGVFLTHAHVGHYAGLMMFGHEAMGAKDIPVHAMPRMSAFLSTNGPWSQLVKYKNINLRILETETPIMIGEGISVTPFLVPHRQEFSEVAGFRINGPNKSVLFIPDIDSWEEWDAESVRIEDKIADVDIAYLDATFFANGEIPGRDMSGFPHPFVAHSMKRFENLPVEEKAKIRFIHMNHTNPLLAPGAPQRRTVRENGFAIAEEDETICL